MFKGRVRKYVYYKGNLIVHVGDKIKLWRERDCKFSKSKYKVGDMGDKCSLAIFAAGLVTATKKRLTLRNYDDLSLIRIISKSADYTSLHMSPCLRIMITISEKSL